MQRRHDLDFVRVAVFPLLILYHASLIYGTRDFLIKSPAAESLFDVFYVLTHPWRMMLLFFVSGASATLALQNGTIDRFTMARMKQLLLPLIVGMLILIPPQIYVRLNDLDGLNIGMMEVFRHYLTLSPLPLPDGRMMPLFGTEHLWYLIYLWCYTVILALAVARHGRHVTCMAEFLGRQLSGPRLFILPVLFLLVVRVTLRPFFPPTLNLATDWYSHALYFPTFLAGALLARHEGFWKEIVRYRSAALILAMTCGAMLLVRNFTVPSEDRGFVDLAYSNVVIAMFRWYAIAAVLGYAKRYCTRAHPAVSYFNKAVLTLYVLHQTVMVLLAHWLNEMHLLGPHAFLPLAILTLMICGLIYEAMRKTRLVLRPPLPAAA
ncbi:acyltransferase family protein [Neorhizobium alkalisoli]|uniref:Acyltransferase-like protein n=1 Tax=Neorhizobium alkalisoli TaxID=528178 RepID=A0A561QWD0_9HYPH|nr:acyltransferase family protein [Neorhizobium alkalisoli]TWF54691.1 acyltransferase-like protein [Neorhizobium alkalisoli]